MRELFPRHTAADVKHEQYVQRHFAERRARHYLRHAVVGDREVCAREPRHSLAAAHHGRVDFHEVDGTAKARLRGVHDQRDCSGGEHPRHRRRTCSRSQRRSSTGTRMT